MKAANHLATDQTSLPTIPTRHSSIRLQSFFFYLIHPTTDTPAWFPFSNSPRSTSSCILLAYLVHSTPTKLSSIFQLSTASEQDEDTSTIRRYVIVYRLYLWLP